MCRIDLKLSFIIILLCLAFRLDAQVNAAGKSFNLSFLQIEKDGLEPTIKVTLIPAEPGTVGTATVTIPGTNFNETVFFNANSGGVGTGLPFGNLGNLTEGKDDFVVQISSDIDLLVYASQYFEENPQNHGDATLVLPDDLLGTQYYVMSHNESTQRFASEALIVATADNTYIDIIPSADTRNFQAGRLETIRLDKGERYQVQSREDLTGTYIGLNQSLNSQCTPFAVFSGSTKSTVGSRTYAGHMFKQLFPIDRWGKSHALLPFDSDENEFLVKVLAAEDNTRLTINGAQNQVIDAGGYMSLNLSRPTQIQSDKPVQVAQFFSGMSSSNDLVDPFMLLTLPNELFTVQRFTHIPRPAIGTLRNLGDTRQGLIFHTEDQGFINHTTPGFEPNISPFAPDPELSYSIFPVDLDLGPLEVNADRQFILYQYDYAVSTFSHSVGIRANAGFKQYDTLTIAIDPLAASAPDRICLSDSVNLKALFAGQDGLRPVYNTFEWDFGDGNTAQGDSVFHKYLLPGEYTVWLRANNGTSLCAREETVSTTITVVDDRIEEVIGPPSVCPNLQGVTYRAVGSADNTYRWTISGGTLQNTTGQEVTVNWGGTNANAYLTVVSENPNGCSSDTLQYPVKINAQLEPGLPRGAAELCATDRLGQVYEAPDTPGSVYDWIISGGRIISGQGTHSILVDWDVPGALPTQGTLQFTESSSTQTDVCAGQSAVLEVTVYRALSMESVITAISCFGDTNGEISLSPQGGKAPYTVLWPDGVSSLSRNDLAADTYDLILTDSIGCEYRATVVVAGPDELSAALALVPVSCHGGGDGQAYLNLTGGTAPYRVSWNDEPFVNATDNLSLTAGVHDVRVLDANNCELLLSFELTEPEPLVATSTDMPSCPGESNGSILVEASGGTPPYTYRWNTSPPQDTQLITGLPAGTYSVTVFDANGCTFTFPNEEIAERLPGIHMPNAFSPNGDGHNDTFGAVADCRLTFHMQIFNEWGTLAYTTDDIYQGWDGTIKGEPAPNGKYSYIIFYSGTVNGVRIEEAQRGTLRLVR